MWYRSPAVVLICLLVASSCARPGKGSSPASPHAAQPLVLDKQGDNAGRSFHVKGRHLYDRCGEKVVLRGVNKMSVWTDQTGAGFPEIRKTGANVVRIVWNVDEHPGDDAFANILDKAVESQLIPMIELHDATGNFERLGDIMKFWTRPEIVAILKQHERHLLLNIANEAGNGHVRVDVFRETYTKAIQQLRAEGLVMPLVIDATRWGQDIDMLQVSAEVLLKADPLQNLIFSAHLWWSMPESSSDPGSSEKIKRELQESVDMNLPLIIGEFAHAGVGCSRFIDYDTILTEAQRHGIGWLAWSWGPGNTDCKEMDMTRNGSFDTLQNWGAEVALTHAASIKNTSVTPESMKTGQCTAASRAR